MRSLTQNFRKKTFFVLLAFGVKSPTAGKHRWGRCWHTIFEMGCTSPKKCHLGSGLNQRDRATCGLGRIRSHREPGTKKTTSGAFGPPSGRGAKNNVLLIAHRHRPKPPSQAGVGCGSGSVTNRQLMPAQLRTAEWGGGVLDEKK